MEENPYKAPVIGRTRRRRRWTLGPMLDTSAVVWTGFVVLLCITIVCLGVVNCFVEIPVPNFPAQR